MKIVDFRPRCRPLRWLLDVGGTLEPDVRRAFEESFFRTPMPIVAGGLNSAIVALLAWGAIGSPWLLLLGLFDCATVLLRVVAIRRARAGRWVPDILFVGSLSWALSQAAAMTLIFQSRDILLILIASTSAVAAASGIAARNFGAHRFALTQILILDLTFKINLLLLGWNGLVAFSFAQSVLHLFTNIALLKGLRSLTIRALEGEAASRALAARDPLTGLANRRGLEDAYARLGGQPIALAIDLDGFKAVNDRHGHAAGDIVLVGVAARLRELCVGVRSVCRLGGDEFVVLAEDLADDECKKLATRLVTLLSAPYRIGEHQSVCVGASIGIARGAYDPLEVLMARADSALYAAKSAGKGRYMLADMPAAEGATTRPPARGGRGARATPFAGISL